MEKPFPAHVVIPSLHLNMIPGNPRATALLALIAALLSGGCASWGEPRPGSGLGWVSRERKERVTHLVIHHTGTDTGRSLRILSGEDPERQVSCHHLVTDETPPRVIPLVPETRVAFHAGVSHWRGRDGLNEVSVGVEIVNPDGNSHPYPEGQFQAVARLCAEIVARHGIDPRNVVAHSDISPGRKVDPGSLFPWRRLHREHGVGPWPSDDALARASRETPALPGPAEIRSLLARWGHPVGKSRGWDEQDARAMDAFQRRFRPSVMGGAPDEESVRILRALLSPSP